MRVRVTKEFLWAEGGNVVHRANVGDVLEGEGAECALAMKAGEVLDTEKAAEPPENKAKPAPKNKAK